MNPAKVVVHVMERNRVLPILKLFGESVGQPGSKKIRLSHYPKMIDILFNSFTCDAVSGLLLKSSA
jgi:hypothetical protein